MPNLTPLSRHIDRLHSAILRKFKRTSVEVHWVHGPPGTGKSYYCREQCPDAFTTSIEPNGQIWFNGYNTTQKDLIIEEAKWTDDSGLLRRVLDYYPFLAPVKLGNPVTAGWTRVFITSNDPPPPEGSPIRDRIAVVKCMDGESFRKRHRVVTPLDG